MAPRSDFSALPIRRANRQDLEGINRLLRQVLTVHHNGRPDLFKPNAKKYTDTELLALFRDDARPVFVCTDENGEIAGYAFCILQECKGDQIACDRKTLYIDDLCVEETKRGQHIGKHLYEYVLRFAERTGCYHVTLNVWCCNPSALHFYEACGMKPQKITMETVLNPDSQTEK